MWPWDNFCQIKAYKPRLKSAPPQAYGPYRAKHCPSGTDLSVSRRHCPSHHLPCRSATPKERHHRGGVSQRLSAGTLSGQDSARPKSAWPTYQCTTRVRPPRPFIVGTYIAPAPGKRPRSLLTAILASLLRARSAGLDSTSPHHGTASTCRPLLSQRAAPRPVSLSINPWSASFRKLRPAVHARYSGHSSTSNDGPRQPVCTRRPSRVPTAAMGRPTLAGSGTIATWSSCRSADVAHVWTSSPLQEPSWTP